MRINLKALGLALVAALAMSAVAASTASAVGQGMLTTTDEEPVTLTGTDDGVNFFESFGEVVECPDSAYTGHATLTKQQTEEGKKHQYLPHGATSVTVTPHYKQTNGATANCDVNEGEFSATINMNGCDYDFYDFTTIENNKYSFTTDLICPGGGPVISVYLGHSHGFKVCTVTVAAGQEGLTGGIATNDESEGEHTITLTGTVHSITSTRTGLCATGADHDPNGKYQLNVRVDAHNELGETVGVTLSHNR